MPALREITILEIFISEGTVTIHSEAFNGFKLLNSIAMNVERFADLPAGLMDPAIDSLEHFQFDTWPANINLDEMFANDVYRMLNMLHIENVALPRTKFRLLASTNFTAFRRLGGLYLIDCGIEVIDEHAFDPVASTLIFINLENNLIKFFNFEMFRLPFESKYLPRAVLEGNGMDVVCTCRIIDLEVLICPMTTSLNGTCVPCKLMSNFEPATCANQYWMETTKFCIHRDVKTIVRQITFRTVHANDTIFMHTKFGSKFRMLFVNLDASLKRMKCIERITTANYECLSMNKSMDRFELNEIGVVRWAEFVSITAIPILIDAGARPMHSITVRQTFVFDDWISDNLMLIGFLAILLGFILGGSTAIARDRMRGDASATADDQGSEYAYPMTSMDANTNGPEQYNYDEIEVGNHQPEDYIEMEDTGYVAAR